MHDSFDTCTPRKRLQGNLVPIKMIYTWDIHVQIQLRSRTVFGLAYIFLAISTHLLLKGFTFMSMCGMNHGLTSARILLFPFPTYYPDTGTGSEDSNRTLVGPLAQPLFKHTSQRLTPLHTLSPAHPLLRASM
jgi:hypothetical protein